MLITAAAISLLGLFAYLLLYSRFVYSIPGGESLPQGGRIILGYECNAATQDAYDLICPKLTDVELRRMAYDPEMLYTEDSLDVVRLSLVGAWMLFTAGLMGAVAWAVAARRARATRRERD